MPTDEQLATIDVWAAPGSTVAVYDWHTSEATFHTVDRLTATQIVVKGNRGDLRFRRADGGRVGESRGELRPTSDRQVINAVVKQRMGDLRREIDKVWRETGHPATILDRIEALVADTRAGIAKLTGEG